MREMRFTTVGCDDAVTTYVAAKALLDDGSSFTTTQMTLLGDMRLLDYDRVTIDTGDGTTTLRNHRECRMWECVETGRWMRYGYDLHRLWYEGGLDG